MGKRGVKGNRINEEVMRGLSEIIQLELKDPRIAPLCSVLSVEVAADLKTAKAYISVLGNEEEAKSTLEGLNSSAGFIRSLLAKRINLRSTPEIIFIMSDSIGYGVRMSKLIDEVVENDNRKP